MSVVLGLSDRIARLAELTGSRTPVREQITRYESAAASRSRECLAAFPRQVIAGPRALVPGAGVQLQEQADACDVRQLDLEPLPVLAVRGVGLPDRLGWWRHAASRDSGVTVPQRVPCVSSHRRVPQDHLRQTRLGKQVRDRSKVVRAQFPQNGSQLAPFCREREAVMRLSR